MFSFVFTFAKQLHEWIIKQFFDKKNIVAYHLVNNWRHNSLKKVAMQRV